MADSPMPVSQWQPIDTAPKNGRTILVWMHNQALVAYWDSQQHHSRPKPFWSTVGPWGACADRDSQPKWWMPLPPAPFK